MLSPSPVRCHGKPRINASSWARLRLNCAGAPAQLSLSRAQLDALILGLPWQRTGEGDNITVV